MDSGGRDGIGGAVLSEFAADCCFEQPGQAGDYTATVRDDTSGGSFYRDMVPVFEKVRGI